MRHLVEPLFAEGTNPGTDLGERWEEDTQPYAPDELPRSPVSPAMVHRIESEASAWIAEYREARR
jgi:hypothetical protein